MGLGLFPLDFVDSLIWILKQNVLIAWLSKDWLMNVPIQVAEYHLESEYVLAAHAMIFV